MNLKNVALVALIGVCLVFTQPGCMTKEEATVWRDNAALVVEEGENVATSLNEEIAAAHARAAAAELMSDQALAAAERATAAMFEDKLDETNRFLEGARAGLVKWDEALAKWDNQSSGWGFVQTIGETVLPFLPPGSQAPAVMALGILGAIGRVVQKSRALNSLAKSTVRLADSNPDVAAAIKKDADTLRKMQTKTAQKAIDAAQGKAITMAV